MMNITRETIEKLVKAENFDAFGIASLEPFTKESNTLEHWIEQGYHGTMGYMAQNLDKRFDIQAMVPGAQSALVVLLNYKPETFQDPTLPQVASYAYCADYHYIIRQKLTRIGEKLQALYPGLSFRAFTDSAPIFERALAVRAGLGWIGKSGLFIHPRLGSYTFIGELILNLDLPCDKAMAEQCGTCEACLKACPTGAILRPYVLDAQRCISYLTIENKAPIKEDLIQKMGLRLYGCDACIEACPWNRFSKAHHHQELTPIPAIFSLNSATFTRGLFKREFKFSPMQRAGFQKIKQQLLTLESYQTKASHPK